MSNEPTNLLSTLQRLIIGALLASIALWVTVQLLLQIWVYLATAITIVVIAYVVIVVTRSRRW